MSAEVFGLLLLLATQTPQDVEQAKQLYSAGTQAYEAANYALAIKSFERAYELAPRANVGYALAQAHRFQFYADSDPAKLRRAIELYQKYLAEVKAGGLRKDAASHLGDLLRIVPTITEVTAAPAGPVVRQTELMLSAQPRTSLATVDDGEALPVPTSVVVEPGKHVVRFFAEGHEDDRQEIVAVEGRLVPVKGTPKPKPASLTIKVESGAKITIDGRSEGVAPLPPLALPAGKYFLAISSNGRRPYGKEIELGLGEVSTLDVKLRGTVQRAFAYVFLGLFSGFATITSLTAYGIFRENGLALDIDRRSRTQALTVDEAAQFQNHVTARDQLVSGTAVAGSVAGVALITAMLLFFVDEPDAPVAPRTQPE